MTEHVESIEGSSIEAVMMGDVTGPGRSEIKVKQTAKEGGARISKNSKKFIFVIIGGLGVAIMAGILAAGNNGKKEATTGQVEASSVGRTPPPSAPQKPQSMFASVSDTPASGVAETQGKGMLSAQVNNSSGQHELSPREKHKAWIEDQKYKTLEGNILAANSAQESGFGDSANSLASQHLQSQAEGNNALNTQTANYGSSIDPSVLSRLASGGTPDAQAQNKSFLAENSKKDDGYLNAMVEDAASQHELLAGSIIPAVLLTALDSDLPGFVTAMVRQTVYDSLNHKLVVIPQGSKLIGRYSSDVAYGQSRALIAWNKLIFPSGAMLDLQGMSGTDGQGQSGFEDQVDHHYTKIFGSSIMMSLLGVGAQLSQPANNVPMTQPTPNQQAAASLATGLASTGEKLLQKNLTIQPTIKIRAGYLFNVMVNQTIIMPTWKE